MIFSVDKQNNNSSLFKIVIEENDYKNKLDEKFKEYSRKIALPGFRPGKVPLNVIKKMHGNEIISEEIMTMADNSLYQYLSDNNIYHVFNPIRTVKNHDWLNEKEFEFEYEVGTVQDFHVNISKDLVGTRCIIDKISDDFLEEFICDIRISNVDFIPVNNTIDNSSIIECELSCDDDALLFKKVAFSIMGIKKNEVKNYFIGKDIDDVVILSFHELATLSNELKYTYTFDENVNYYLIIKGINTLNETINPALFSKLFPDDCIESEVDFKKILTEKIIDSLILESEKILELELFSLIVKQTDITLPEEFMKMSIRKLGNDLLDEKEVEESYKSKKGGIIRNIISKKILKENNIKIESESVEKQSKNHILNMFYYYHKQGFNFDSIKNLIHANSDKILINAYETLEDMYAMQFIKDSATLKSINVSDSEFVEHAKRIYKSLAS